MNRRLLDILRCPITGQSLRELDAGELESLNQLIADGGLKTRGGETAEPLRAALITDNREWIYAVDDGVPVMLPDQALAADEVGLGRD